MKKNKIWLSSPHMGGNEIKYIQEAFEENWIAPLGPNVIEFENSIQNYLGDGNYVTALSSGTAAIHLGLILLGVEKDDEVLCQSMTFAASANPIMYLGAKPIFVDSEKDTWNMCPESLEEAIIDRIKKGKKPKAIIPVHLYGMPYKHREIKSISERYEIPILEDSAEALGSTYYGEKCGSLGDLSILSFNGNKIITSSGGGALVCKSEIQQQKSLFLATQARDDAPHYQHSEIGYNYRLSNISAGIGRGQMEVLDDRVDARRKIFNFYKEFLKTFSSIHFQEEPNKNYYSNHWLTAIYFNTSDGFKLRERLRNGLLRENIESRPLWKPMHMQPVYENYPYYGDKNSESLFNNGLCLPSGSNLTNNQIDRIKNTILALLSNV